MIKALPHFSLLVTLLKETLNAQDICNDINKNVYDRF